MMTSEEADLLTVTESDEGKRLDAWLAERFQEGYSRVYFQELIAQQLVLVNGCPAKKSLKLCVGDELEIRFIAVQRETSLLPEAIPLAILYEDEDLLIVNKPAGMVVHPAPGHWSGTFVHALLHHCTSLAGGASGSLRPGIVHRLDKDTSGLLVAAKHLRAQQELIALFASRQVYKEYWAICAGRPPEGVIDAPIGRHPLRRKEMAVVPAGKAALTICKHIQSNGPLSAVQLELATGRTHQIRVHLKHKGAPILGDELYGDGRINRRYAVHRQLLHAAWIKFKHPLTGTWLHVTAPPPADIQAFLHKIGAVEGTTFF